jgi:DNA-binding MarR family transcriptional regulator
VDGDGITVGQLHARARTSRDSLNGLLRWGYVTIDGADGPRPGPGGRLDGRAGDLDRRVRATVYGDRAREVWRPLADLVTERWRQRFGPTTVESLVRDLRGVARQIPLALPLYLPVVYPTQNGKTETLAMDTPPPTTAERSRAVEGLDLSALLAQVLMAFTLDFERRSRLALPVCADTLAVLHPDGIRVRDLPTLSGVSREAQAMTVGFLARHGCVVVEPDPAASRGKVVRLTEKGGRALSRYRANLATTEDQWTARFGATSLTRLRRSLEKVAEARGQDGASLLLQGTTPYPDGWRASVPRPERLPDHPMVLHRGGYPDGS